MESTEEKTFEIEIVVNDEQLEAVTKPLESNVQVIAGPGTGKTRTIAYRTAYLVSQNVSPDRVLILTLTNRAIQEFRNRIGSIVGQSIRDRLQIHTFHSFSQWLLTQHGHLIGLTDDWLIADKWDQAYVLENVRNKLNITNKKKFHALKDAALESKLRKSRNMLFYSDQQFRMEADQVLAEYNMEMQRSNLLDYDDLIIMAGKLLKAFPSLAEDYSAVLVDELQDVSYPCWNILRLASSTSTLFAVGDPDQCIYSFIGADSSLFGRMRAELPNVQTVTLNTNYRSQQKILDTAIALLEQDPDRSTGVIPLASHVTENKAELPSPKLLRFIHNSSENVWISREVQRLHLEKNVPIEQIVILARTSYALKGLMEELKRHDINPVLIGGASILETQTANLVITIMRMLQFPHRNIFIWQLLRAYKVFISPTALKTAMERAQSMPLLEVLENHQLWISSKNSTKIQEFLDMIRKANAIFQENPTSLENLLTSINYVIEKIEYKKTIMKRFSVSSYVAKIQELEDLFDYIRSLQPTVESKLASDQDSRSCLEIVLQSTAFYNVTPQPGQLVVSTVHAAKGLEWPIVFLTNVHDNSIPSSRSHDSPDQIKEERRLLYVALTRAQDELILTFPQHQTWSQLPPLNNTLQRSRFLTTGMLKYFNQEAKQAQKQSVAAQWKSIQHQYPTLFKPPPSLKSTPKTRRSYHTIASMNQTQTSNFYKWQRFPTQPFPSLALNSSQLRMRQCGSALIKMSKVTGILR